MKKHDMVTWPFLEITQRESPALATASCFSPMTATQAVHPEVGPEKSECGPCTKHTLSQKSKLQWKLLLSHQEQFKHLLKCPFVKLDILFTTSWRPYQTLYHTTKLVHFVSQDSQLPPASLSTHHFIHSALTKDIVRYSAAFSVNEVSFFHVIKHNSSCWSFE